jgi:hypothetical protein
MSSEEQEYNDFIQRGWSKEMNKACDKWLAERGIKQHTFLSAHQERKEKWMKQQEEEKRHDHDERHPKD